MVALANFVVPGILSLLIGSSETTLKRSQLLGEAVHRYVDSPGSLKSNFGVQVGVDLPAHATTARLRVQNAPALRHKATGHWELSLSVGDGVGDPKWTLRSGTNGPAGRYGSQRPGQDHPGRVIRQSHRVRSFTTDFLVNFVRDNDGMSLEDAHWRLSKYAAGAAQMHDRGSIAVGMPADIIVYDLRGLRILPEEIAYDFPGGEWRRIKRAEGYDFTIVNGVVTFEGLRCTGATPGRLLRFGRAQDM